MASFDPAMMQYHRRNLRQEPDQGHANEHGLDRGAAKVSFRTHQLPSSSQPMGSAVGHRRAEADRE
jgi:hypothetical protein